MTEILKKIRERIQELMAEGVPIAVAVKMALREYPVMKHVEKRLRKFLKGDYEKGYGQTISNKKSKPLLREPWTADGVKLSERIHKNAKLIEKTVTQVIEEQAKRGVSWKESALELFDGYVHGPEVLDKQTLPKFIQDLLKIKRPIGDEEAERKFKQKLRRIRHQINVGENANLKAAYNELLDAIEERNQIAIDKAIKVAINEKTRYVAERIERTERHRAVIEGVYNQHIHDDTVIAFQWHMNDKHPIFDICDMYANADLYGLGKGIYPKDKVPLIPVHPHCMCWISPVYIGMLENETPEEQLDEGGQKYIDGLTVREQEQLLGVHGRKEVLNGKVKWQERCRGYDGAVLRSRIEKEVKADENNVFKRNEFKNIGVAKSEESLYNKFKGRHEFHDDGRIKVTKSYPKDERHSPQAVYEPNDVVMFWTKGDRDKQVNILLCDKDGVVYRRLHYGNHGFPKDHNFGTRDKPNYNHVHEIMFNNDRPEEYKVRVMTREEELYI